MVKIKSLFVREFFDNHSCKAKNEVEQGCEWVINGEGVATRKYDGTCCLIQDGKIYKRFDYKVGRKLPNGAIPCQEKADEITGHFPHWVLCDVNNPSDKWHIEAFDKYRNFNMENGTYELCGVHFQNNIDNVCDKGDRLIPHGNEIIEVERTFDGIKQFLTDNYIEGIVFHRDNGEMCKIKRSDFGLQWGNKKR